MVIIASRGVTPVLAATVTVTVPSPEPDVCENVSHDAVPGTLTVQLMLEVTVNAFGESVAAKLNEPGDTCKIGLTPDCVTLTVRGCKP